jgi:hypothetical protein
MSGAELNALLANPFRVERLENDVVYPACYPGLEFANTFGVGFKGVTARRVVLHQSHLKMTH